MLTLEEGLYVRIQELDNGPRPFPLESGFNMRTAYRALGLFNPSESSDAYFILANDRDEIWFICNKHLRVVCVNKASQAFRTPLPSPPTALTEVAAQAASSAVAV